MISIETIKKRYSKAKGNYEAYSSILRDAYTYALPDKGYFDTISNGYRTKKVYDSTAILGVGTYADKVQQNIVPPWRKWFVLEPGSEIPEELHEQVQPALDNISDTLYDHINHSNFNTKMNEALQDVAISTGILTCEEGDGIESSLTFNSIPVEEVALEESQNGIVDNVYRKFKIKIRDIESSIRGSKLTPKLSKKLTEDVNAKIDLIEAVVRNDKGTYDHVIFDEEDEGTIYEVEDDSNPYIVFRERVTSKGVYGMGRVIQLLTDIKVLNKLAEMDLKNAGLAISGVYTATDDGVFNPYNTRLVPGTIIPVASNANGNPTLRPLERSGDFNVAMLKMEQKQELITKVLFGQALGSITKTPVRTATEVNERVGESYELSSAAFSRFQTELLERLIKRMVDVLSKAGKIAPIVIDGKEVTIKFTSPSAKQQDQNDVTTIVNYANTLAATGIPMETLGTKIKFEDVPGYIAENMGIPSKLIRTEEEEEEYTAKQQQAMQAQMMATQQGGQA